eukprot:g27823.t1
MRYPVTRIWEQLLFGVEEFTKHCKQTASIPISNEFGTFCGAPRKDPHAQVFCQGHDDFVTCLAVSHNGQMFATGQQGDNADVILWSFEGKTQLSCFQDSTQDHGIDALAFSHDDRFLISCGDIVDQRVFVYDTNSCLIVAWAALTPKPTLCVLGGGMVRDIKRRDTHEYQYAACGGKNICMWHLDPVRGELQPHQVGNAFKQVREYICLAFTQDAEYLLAGTTTGDVAVVLMKNRVVQTFIAVCGGGVVNLVCTLVESGSRFVAAGGDGTVTVLAGPNALELHEDIQQEIFRLTGAPAYRQRLLFESDVLDPRRRLQDLGFTKERLRELRLTLIVQDILWLATTSVDGGVKIWDANTGEQIQSLGGHQSGVRHACFSSDGCTLLTAARDCTAKIWNTLTGEPVEIFKGHTNAVYTAVFSEDGYLVLTASYDGTARLWYVLTGECIKTFSGHNDGVVSAIFAHDGLSILTASVDRSAKIWDLQTAECVQTLTRPRGEVIVSVFSTPVQNWALSTLQEGTAKLWNIKTQQCVHTLKGHHTYITSATLSPDANWLLTASWDRSVKLWSLTQKKNRKCAKTFQGHGNGVVSAEFSSDMSHIVTAASDGATKIWNVQSGECVSTLGSASMIRSKDLSVKPHSQVSPGALYDVAHLANISDHFLTCSGDSLVTLWDANDYTAKLRCSVGTRAYPLAACGTEDIFVAGATDGRLLCWDCSMGGLDAGRGRRLGMPALPRLERSYYPTPAAGPQINENSADERELSGRTWRMDLQLYLPV